MRNLTIILRSAVCAFVAISAISASAQDRQQRLSDHVYYLASDTLQGRKAGTEFSRKAASYLISNYEEIGLKPFFKEWTMPFSKDGGQFANVVGVIEGNDPQLKDEYIVLGAHFDHLGVKKDQVYNGADDNASGSAALIEIARELYKNRENLKRSVIIAGFDAEELGLFGSTALADSLKKHGKNVKLMMSIDMVGWYSVSGKLQLEGTSTIKDGKTLIESEASKVGIVVDPVNFETSVMTATDTQGFALQKIPTLAVSTGLKSPYHKPEDDAELIDYSGLDKVSEYITGLTETVASDPDFSASGKVARKHLGRYRLLEAGVVAGLGSTNFDFPKSAITGKGAFSYHAGLQLNYNFAKHFSIVTQGLYESSAAHFPAEDDAFNTSYRYKQQAVTVPVLFQMHGTDIANYNFGIGPYYTHLLKDNGAQIPLTNVPPIEQNQFGICYSFGFRVANLVWNVDVRSQLNPFFTTETPAAGLRRATLTLGYIF